MSPLLLKDLDTNRSPHGALYFMSPNLSCQVIVGVLYVLWCQRPRQALHGIEKLLPQTKKKTLGRKIQFARRLNGVILLEISVMIVF